MAIDLYDLKKRAAAIIDSEWKYSWHWGKFPKERHWTMDALHDAQERILNCQKDLKLLQNIHSELSEISKLYYPESEEDLQNDR